MRSRLRRAVLLSGGKSAGIIYGASWDKGATVNAPLTRTDSAVGLVANAGVDAGVVVNDFDSAEIYRDITEVTDALGNVFVRIPKFYIEKTDGVGYKTWRISRMPFGTAYLPKCFVSSAGAALPYIDVGKYPASLDGGGTNLCSVASVYPLINKNIAEFRGYAQANGAGYQQLDIHVTDVLQTLFYVEFATLHTQSIMAGYATGQYAATHLATVTEVGANRIVVANAHAALYEVGQAISIGTTQGGNQIFYGRNITGKAVYDAANTAIEFDGAPADITIGNMLYNTGWENGFSSGIAASSGSIVSNSTGKYPCIYRGIENPWGNVWQFVDGVNINDLQAWVCADAASYASNLFAAPYSQLSYINHNASGYTTAMGYDAALPYAALPTAVGGAGNTYYSDYHYQNVGQRIARLGGDWSSGSYAGLSCWFLNYASSSTLVTIGGRLLRKAL
jgi:hypothetical protein